MLSKTVCQDFVCKKTSLGCAWPTTSEGCGNASALHPVVELWAKRTLHSGVLATFILFWVVATQTFFFFTPKIGEDFQFDEHIFQQGWFNHQQVFLSVDNEQKSGSRSWMVRTLDNHLMKHGGVKHGGFSKPTDTRNYQGLDSKATTLLVEIDPIGRAASSQPGSWKTTNHQLENRRNTIYKVWQGCKYSPEVSFFFRKLSGLCKGTADGDATEGRCLVLAANDEIICGIIPFRKIGVWKYPFLGGPTKNTSNPNKVGPIFAKLSCFLFGPVFSDILMQTKWNKWMFTYIQHE